MNSPAHTIRLAALIIGALFQRSVSAQCGTTVYDPGGSGGNYGNSANWTVTYCPTNPGDAVTLTFTMFNTESGYDFVRIYNGPNTGSPMLGPFSGTAVPGPFTSTDPSGCLTLNFTSDGSLTYAGWVANITCAPLAPPPSVCNTTVYDPGGAGGNYGNSMNYVVTYCPDDPSDPVTMVFSMLNTEAGFDFVTIYNGPNTGSPSMGTFSGTNIPGPFTSTHPSGCLTLQFTSDGSLTYAGWAATIYCGDPPPPPSACGTTVYDPGGAGGNYGNNANYVVTYCPDDPGDVVTLNFTAFNTEANFDFVTIYNGPGIGFPSMGTYSGAGIPGSFTSTHPTGCITLQFTSDGSFTYSGWTANVICGDPPPPPGGDCVYILNLYDSWGDGWGSSSVGISINGGPYTYYTVTGGYNQVLIGVNIGDVIAVNYNNSGGFQGENSYSIGIQGGGNYFSSGSPPAAGIQFIQTVTCEPPATPQQDCLGSMTICNGQSFNNNSNNTGNIVDLHAGNRGCLTLNERQGTWYVFSPSEAGTIGMSLAPVGTADYDFAVWGPYPPGSTPSTFCPPAGPPIRCSYDAPGPYTTGMVTGAGQDSEGASGTGWVNSINVTVGQVYLLYIDNWSSNGQEFGLSWQLTNGASLDCTVLPVEMASFQATPEQAHVQLTWRTMSEVSSERFDVEHSLNGMDFTRIGTVEAAGTSYSTIAYSWPHMAPLTGTLNHYRLKQVDQDGSFTYSQVESVLFKADGRTLVPRPNPANDMVSVDLPEAVPSGSIIEVLDASGRVVLTRSNGTDGPQAIGIPIATLDAGSYVMRIVATDHSVVGQGRFVKQ